MKKTCQICGKNSGIYPLCKIHLEMKSEGKIIKNNITNLWEFVKEPDDWEEDEGPFDFEDWKPIKKQEDFLIESNQCIICRQKTNYKNHLFCYECYSKYKSKTILLKIKNCNSNTIELYNDIEKYPDGLKYMCIDGHIVRSKSEMAIDNYLFNHNIRHIYEKPLPIDNNKENDLYPDFYLPDLDIYIEHWSNISNNYNEQKNYKINIYKKLGVTIISTIEEDIQDIETSLTRKLKFYKKGEIN